MRCHLHDDWRFFDLGSSDKSRSIEYPFSKPGVYLSAILAALSIVLALLLLTDPIALILYFASTCLLTFVTLEIKIYVFSRRKSEAPEEYSVTEPEGSSNSSNKWKTIFLMVCFVIGMAMPLILLSILDVTSWFISLNGFISGVSLSEVILFYYYSR
jgi:hypothetical protein